LYSASAGFVRHTLNALYADLDVELKRITVDNSSSSSAPSTLKSANEEDQGKKQHRRKKDLFVALKVSGNNRVSGGIGEWEVSV
jgi:hypothetical protein